MPVQHYVWIMRLRGPGLPLIFIQLFYPSGKLQPAYSDCDSGRLESILRYPHIIVTLSAPWDIKFMIVGLQLTAAEEMSCGLDGSLRM